MSNWQHYRKKHTQEMRSYLQGEDLYHPVAISVSPADTPGPGGMIARNPDNHADQWYVAKDFFAKNYELVDVPVRDHNPMSLPPQRVDDVTTT